MTFAAIESVRVRTPSTWDLVPFKRIAVLREEADVAATATLLSLKNTGELVARGEDVQPPSDEHRLRYWRVDPGDLVVNPMWLAGGAIGVSLVSGAVSPDYRVYSLAARVEPRFLHHLLRSVAYHDQYRLLMRAETTFDRRVTKDDFADLPVLVPPLGDQRAVADYLNAETSRIDALIEKKRQMIDVLEERRIVVTASAVTNPMWPRVKLTLVARLGSGHTPSRDRPDWWENSTIPWITTGDVHQMRGDRIEFIEETKFSISELGLANSAAELHPARTVVLSRTASVGFSAIMARPMATSQDFATWTCGPRLRPRFLLLCLRAMRRELLGQLAMGSTHKTIYMPAIESIRVPLPPVETQDRAVDDVWERLRPIDATVAAIERQIGLLRERRQALITTAVTGELLVGKAAA